MPCITQAPEILTVVALATSTLLRWTNIARAQFGGGCAIVCTGTRLVMFGIGPAYLFILQYRLPVGMMRGGWQPWASTMETNLAISLIVGVLVWLIGIKAVPAHSPSDHAARVISRGVAVLCATSIRAHDLGG